MRATLGWVVIGALAAGTAGAGFWQQAMVHAARAEWERRQAADQAAVVARAAQTRAENDREAMAAALADARADVAVLTKQLDAAKAEAATRAEAARFAVDVPMPASEWRNAGYATPKAALETVLWASAGGDVDALAQSLMFMDDRTRREARALWDAVPQSFRDQYGTPDKLIAFLATKDIPAGSAQVRRAGDLLAGWPAPAEIMEVLLTATDRQRKSANLLFMNRGDGWKLVVTEPVVAKYAAALVAPVATTAIRPAP